MERKRVLSYHVCSKSVPDTSHSRGADTHLFSGYVLCPRMKWEQLALLGIDKPSIVLMNKQSPCVYPIKKVFGPLPSWIQAAAAMQACSKPQIFFETVGMEKRHSLLQPEPWKRQGLSCQTLDGNPIWNSWIHDQVENGDLVWIPRGKKIQFCAVCNNKENWPRNK